MHWISSHSLELHFACFIGLFVLILLCSLGSHVLTVLLVLLLIESGLTFTIDESIVNAKLLLGVRLELNHLLNGENLANAAAV